jgi:hypothetical protein
MCKNECVCDGLECRAAKKEMKIASGVVGVGNGKRFGRGPLSYLLRETFEEIEFFKEKKKTKWEMWSFLFDGEPHFSVNETLKS